MGQDSTVKSGSIYPMTLSKQLRLQRLSLCRCFGCYNCTFPLLTGAALQLPFILLVDSGGAFLPLQAEIFNRGGNIFKNQAVSQAYYSVPHVCYLKQFT